MKTITVKLTIIVESNIDKHTDYCKNMNKIGSTETTTFEYEKENTYIIYKYLSPP